MKVRREIADNNPKELARALRYTGYNKEERRRFLGRVSIEEKVRTMFPLSLLTNRASILATAYALIYYKSNQIISAVNYCIPDCLAPDRNITSAIVSGAIIGGVLWKTGNLLDRIRYEKTNKLMKIRDTNRINNRYIKSETKIPLEIIEGDKEYANLGLDTI